MKSIIHQCGCKHKGQDDLHGKGNRVMNPTMRKTGEGTRVYRCTVCLKELNTKEIK